MSDCQSPSIKHVLILGVKKKLDDSLLVIDNRFQLFEIKIMSSNENTC